MLYFFTDHTNMMLVSALVFILVYETINGFHDTANAVAIVIYTQAMHARLAVIMSGIFNFLGVLMGGLSVAYAIVHLINIDLLLNVDSIHGLAIIFSILSAAILWNILTWYFGLPISSSHTLIGAIVGVGLMHAMIAHTSLLKALNIPNLMDILLSLTISPIIGLCLSSIIIICYHFFYKKMKTNTNDRLSISNNKCPPPFWTRCALILSSAGVSFSHGANDGQKGIGLIMLALISIAPSSFLININANSCEIRRTRDAIDSLQKYYSHNNQVFNKIAIDTHSLFLSGIEEKNLPLSFSLEDRNNNIAPFLKAINVALLMIDNIQSYDQLNIEKRLHLRKLLIYISDITDQVAKLQEISYQEKQFLRNLYIDLVETIEYAPLWIIIIVAIALSLGTIVGWKRIAITLGEKIGPGGITYIQGLSVQITATLSIGAASYTGMPVSTTHVVSSAVLGAMLAEKRSVGQKVIKNIIMAWLLTLPVAIILASLIYFLILNISKIFPL
ncbi:inorganic phosphate transporter [Candidatus Schneideria nysicola]|uniref:inorganic phosphate transporter n=1 Tax=Candidatus Schneideria nysicola TaxID=1081631 RepID=UPI001CAA4CBC|nr:inorganic phosphate transporter [Candidatus Schneideria nysicola]UAJ65054.1 inorganic phosphate transporter [Candidatus Schneideria nysicola]